MEECGKFNLQTGIAVDVMYIFAVVIAGKAVCAAVRAVLYFVDSRHRPFYVLEIDQIAGKRVFRIPLVNCLYGC